MSMKNPYLNLWQRLKNEWKDEGKNSQARFQRQRFLEIFIEVYNSNPLFDMSALNFFTLMELVAIRIIMKKVMFQDFLTYFTPKHFLQDEIIDRSGMSRRKHPQLEFYAGKIKRRMAHVCLQSKLLKHQFPKLARFALLKITYLDHCHKKRYLDPYYYERLMIHQQKLSGYFKWCIKIGKRFSNRVEFDFSNTYLMTTQQEDTIKKEERDKVDRDHA